jgi:uncharacterized membrane protein
MKALSICFSIMLLTFCSGLNWGQNSQNAKAMTAQQVISMIINNPQQGGCYQGR